jgi:hypothetical protein
MSSSRYSYFGLLQELIHNIAEAGRSRKTEKRKPESIAILLIIWYSIAIRDQRKKTTGREAL